MTDRRAAPVEANLLRFLAAMAANPSFGSDHQPDVDTYWSDVPFPVLNGLFGSRIPAGTEAARVPEVLTPFLERGLPFLWWGVPSAWTPALHDAIVAAGLWFEESPGMHLPLDALPEERPVDGLTLELVGPAGARELAATMCPAFDMPAFVEEPLTELFGAVALPGMHHLLARLDGEPVGTGTVVVDGPTAGLYNIGTLEAVRGRGVGYAVTRGLLEAARDRGAVEAILHATALGRPVYERLGFVEVCRIPQYAWMPGLT